MLSSREKNNTAKNEQNAGGREMGCFGDDLNSAQNGIRGGSFVHSKLFY
jgi:hypothetical protein